MYDGRRGIVCSLFAGKFIETFYSFNFSLCVRVKSRVNSFTLLSVITYMYILCVNVGSDWNQVSHKSKVLGGSQCHNCDRLH